MLYWEWKIRTMISGRISHFFQTLPTLRANLMPPQQVVTGKHVEELKIMS
jgi:hypothetical protein